MMTTWANYLDKLRTGKDSSSDSRLGRKLAGEDKASPAFLGAAIK